MGELRAHKQRSRAHKQRSTANVFSKEELCDDQIFVPSNNTQRGGIGEGGVWKYDYLWWEAGNGKTQSIFFFGH